ncbi:MAG: FlgD immunoglobulin-like domain containing protein [Bacteroidota bacterium]
MAKSGNYTATLSGTLVNQASATTTWFLYPGACQDRVNGPAPGLGTWAAKSAIVADSMNSYTTGTQGGYGVQDQSVKELLWHTTDVAHANHATQEAAVLAGNSSLWCGKYDANWVNKVGYPNLTFQILYIDTGSHGAGWNLSFIMNTSDEQNYDYVHFIGGGNNDVDPIGNARPKFDNLLATGADANELMLVNFTGSIQQAANGGTYNVTAGGVNITGSGGSQPTTAAFTFNMRAGDRALYILKTADCLFSSEDGLWPYGHGVVIDNMVASDNGTIYSDTGTPVGTDPVQPPGAGVPIQGSFGNLGYIAGRVTAGAGELWQIVDGGFAATADNCSLQKNSTSDHFFFGVDASTKNTVPGQFNSIVSCTFPVPAGTASITALWGEYLDLPRGSGYVQFAEYRFFSGGVWSGWLNAFGTSSVRTSVIKTWTVDGNELAQATQADSLQLRYNLQCIPPFTFDGVTCGQVTYAVMYDDLYLAVLTGVPAPVFNIFPGNLAQSTFVDGTLTGVNCATPPCWPGVRGSDVVPTPGNSNVDIHNNFNSPLGDTIAISLQTGLRKNGMGINWRLGYQKGVNEGLSISVTNGSYNPAFDQPRVIYRLFDPSTKTWSPFDSTVLDANYVAIAGSAVGDTTVINSEFRFDWPPRDKAGLNLPGGFTINGVGAYGSLSFLPRGTRMQYYFKAVDINGGIAYQFSSDNLGREVADLPTLPGGTAVAPDIVEFDVLPGVYAAGHAGTLLAGVTNTPILNLDGSYSAWSFQQDPVTQALRGMGVRADRYRLLQGLDEGNNFGGHELLGAPDNQRPGRLSNYFPNMTEYAIRESLSTWYRVLIQSGHLRTATLDDEPDARLLDEWWNSPTPGSNGGDRCVFTSGDDYFNAIMNTAAGDPAPRRHTMGNDVFGINSVNGSWNGTASVLYPQVTDNFSGQTYPVDGGCPGPNRFDALIKQGTSDAQNVAFYPVFSGITDVAGVATMSEKDAVTDNDRSKALGYGFSIQFVRKPGMTPTGTTNYVHSGVAERMQILYKFLASCRGPRSGAPGDTAKCWPCPVDANITGNWAALAGFSTGSFGPLYAIQDNQVATGVEIGSGPEQAPKVNRLDGNYPNPFNPQTTIRFSSATAGKVTIRIFNVGGQLVRTLSTKADTGANEVRWNGRNDGGSQLASGVYFYKVKFADGTESGSRMALVK